MDPGWIGRGGEMDRGDGFKGRQFTAEVILWAVRWYLMFPISYRDLAAHRQSAHAHGRQEPSLSKGGRGDQERRRTLAPFSSPAMQVSDGCVCQGLSQPTWRTSFFKLTLRGFPPDGWREKQRERRGQGWPQGRR